MRKGKYKSPAIYVVFGCGVVLTAIAVYMKVNNIVTQGEEMSRRPLSDSEDFIDGYGAILIAVLFWLMLVLIYYTTRKDRK